MEKEYYEEAVQPYRKTNYKPIIIHITTIRNGYSLRVVGVPQSRVQDCANCIQLLVGDIESNPGPKPTLKPFYTHSLNLHTLTKYTNSPVQPCQSSPPSLSPVHSPPNSPTSVQSHLSPLKNTPTYHRASIQLHTLIYLKQHTGPLDVSREGSSSASKVERTPGKATLLGCRTPPHLHAGGVGRQQ